MAIQSPNSPPKPSRSAIKTAAFVEVAGFTFRLRDVDGFLHTPTETTGASARTTVYFKGYSAVVVDPNRELHRFLRDELL